MAAQDMLVDVMVDPPKHLAAGFGLVIAGKLNFKVSSCRSIGETISRLWPGYAGR
jgi:hypothetical protein